MIALDLAGRTDIVMLQFRRAGASDKTGIVRLHIEASQETYGDILPKDYLQAVLPKEKQALWHRRFSGTDTDHTTLVAADKSDVIGFCCFPFGEQMQFGTYLHNLYVKTAYRRRGLASSLLCAAIATL